MRHWNVRKWKRRFFLPPLSRIWVNLTMSPPWMYSTINLSSYQFNNVMNKCTKSLKVIWNDTLEQGVYKSRFPVNSYLANLYPTPTRTQYHLVPKSTRTQYHLVPSWAVVADVWFGYELTCVRVGIGYGLTWVRVGLGTSWYWVRVDLGTGWRWVRVG